MNKLTQHLYKFNVKFRGKIKNATYTPFGVSVTHYYSNSILGFLKLDTENSQASYYDLSKTGMTCLKYYPSKLDYWELVDE